MRTSIKHTRLIVVVVAGALWGIAPARAASFAGKSDTQIAQAFRPWLHFAQSARCLPLNFHEIQAGASTSDRDGLKKHCSSSFASDFAVFASVKHSDGTHAA